MFRSGVRPVWEDEANKSGGRWVIPSQSHAHLREVWSELTFSVVGAQFGLEDEVRLVAGWVVVVMVGSWLVVLLGGWLVGSWVGHYIVLIAL